MCLIARSVLVGMSFRVLLLAEGPIVCPGHDLLRVHDMLHDAELTFSPPPYRGVPSAPRRDSFLRTYICGLVVIVSDGFVCGERLEWGALIASADGVLATTSGELLADCPSSWAAEWVRKIEGALLAGRLSVPESALAFAVADNILATLGADGGRPSRCAWVDALRLGNAGVCTRPGLLEIFTLAQPDTLWTGPLAEWHRLAKTGPPPVATTCRPSPEVVTDTALYHRGGRLVLSLEASLDAAYDDLVVSGLPGSGALPCAGTPLS